MDDTLEDGDCLTAATLLENRDLRNSLIQKDQKLGKLAEQIQAKEDIEKDLKDTKKKLDVAQSEIEQLEGAQKSLAAACNTLQMEYKASQANEQVCVMFHTTSLVH
eukprot:m.91056 g.91056  ORF g.91056 m.91056 type:complete len:106 (+) comp13288_c0_seq2:931-1248(+)